MAKAGAKSNLTAPLLDLEEGRNISQLQYVLKLAHSPELTDQQKVRNLCTQGITIAHLSERGMPV